MHVSFLKPHPPYRVSEPWHSLIDPSSLEPLITNIEKEKRIKQHPLMKNIIEYYEVNDNHPPEINYSKLTTKDIARIQTAITAASAK